jgi:hypothetical protein
MTRSFILSRPTDIEIARICQQHMAGHGFEAHILIDPREWVDPPGDLLGARYSTMGKGMYGNDCASGILDGILHHSLPGDRVVKADCDVWLSTEAAEWLSERGPARAMNVFHRRWMQWGGCWAADHEHVLQARAHADTLPRCNCAESYLNLRCLHERTPGCQAPEWAVVNQWSAGGRGFAATLPIHLRHQREREACKLFAS